MSPSCQEHRKWMELLGLQLQVKNNALDPKDKEKIEELIRALEKELGLD